MDSDYNFVAEPILYYDALNSHARSCYMLIKILKIHVNIQPIDSMDELNFDETCTWLNCYCKLPTLIDGRITLSNGHSILIYLCQKYTPANLSNLCPCDFITRQKITSILCYESCVLHRCLSHLLTDIFLAKYPNFNAEYHKKKVSNAYNSLNTYLKMHSYLIGNHLTIADISVLSTVSALNVIFPVDYEKFPKLFEWFQGLKKTHFYGCNDEGIQKLRYLLKNVCNFPFPSPFTNGKSIDGRRSSTASRMADTDDHTDEEEFSSSKDYLAELRNSKASNNNKFEIAVSAASSSYDNKRQKSVKKSLAKVSGIGQDFTQSSESLTKPSVSTNSHKGIDKTNLFDTLFVHVCKCNCDCHAEQKTQSNFNGNNFLKHHEESFHFKEAMRKRLLSLEPLTSANDNLPETGNHYFSQPHANTREDQEILCFCCCKKLCKTNERDAVTSSHLKTVKKFKQQNSHDAFLKPTQSKEMDLIKAEVNDDESDNLDVEEEVVEQQPFQELEEEIQEPESSAASSTELEFKEAENRLPSNFSINRKDEIEEQNENENEVQEEDEQEAVDQIGLQENNIDNEELSLNVESEEDYAAAEEEIQAVKALCTCKCIETVNSSEQKTTVSKRRKVDVKEQNLLGNQDVQDLLVKIRQLERILEMCGKTPLETTTSHNSSFESMATEQKNAIYKCCGSSCSCDGKPLPCNCHNLPVESLEQTKLENVDAADSDSSSNTKAKTQLNKRLEAGGGNEANTSKSKSNFKPSNKNYSRENITQIIYYDCGKNCCKNSKNNCCDVKQHLRVLQSRIPRLMSTTSIINNEKLYFSKSNS